jgi:hypothetical protein
MDRDRWRLVVHLRILRRLSSGRVWLGFLNFFWHRLLK